METLNLFRLDGETGTRHYAWLMNEMVMAK